MCFYFSLHSVMECKGIVIILQGGWYRNYKIEGERKVWGRDEDYAFPSYFVLLFRSGSTFQGGGFTKTDVFSLGEDCKILKLYSPIPALSPPSLPGHSSVSQVRQVKKEIIWQLMWCILTNVLLLASSHILSGHSRLLWLCFDGMSADSSVLSVVRITLNTVKRRFFGSSIAKCVECQIMMLSHFLQMAWFTWGRGWL